MPTQNLSDQIIAQERQELENTLIIEKSSFKLGEIFTKPYYPADRKVRKQKLGSLYQVTFKDRPDCLCRVMNYDRISTYQVEAYFNELARLKLYKMMPFILAPVGVYVTSKMEINVIFPLKTSLFDLLHQIEKINNSDPQGMSLLTKVDILVNLAKLMNTLHSLPSPLAHGNLNPHNIFVTFETDSEGNELPQI